MAGAAARAGRETWRRLLRERRGTITMQWAVGAAVLAGVAVASFPQVQGGVARTASGIEDVLAGRSNSDSRSAHQATLDAARKDAAEQAERQRDSQPGGGVLGAVAGSDAGAERSGSASGSGGGGSDGSSPPGSGADTGPLRAKSYDDVNALQRSAPEESSKDATGRFSDAVDAGSRLNDALQDAADAHGELRGEGSGGGGSGAKSEPGEVEVRFYRGSSKYVDDD